MTRTRRATGWTARFEARWGGNPVSFTTLVDSASLAAHRDDPSWRVIDVRHQLADPEYGEAAYRSGHIPGAVFMHCDRDLSGPRTGKNGRHPLPDPSDFVSRMAYLGVGPGVQVVLYDDSQGMFAGRLWWMLRWVGHYQVALLDGGLAAWIGASGSLHSGQVSPRPSPAWPPRVAEDMVVDAAAVAARCLCPGTLVVDARSPDRYRGENETIDPVGGHIPGASNRFFRDNLEAGAFFKPAEQLRAEWEALLAGVAPADVVHQCGSGVSACHNILAMEIAGLTGSRLYAGSWSEWCADPGRPFVIGPSAR